MAGEAFAGDSITQKPGKRPDRGGIYLNLREIPNAPKPPQMGLAKYPEVPAIRQKYMEPVSGFEARAAKMQQKPLPSGIMEGLERGAQAAGKGQAAMGEAIADVGAKTAKALDSVGDTIAKFAHQANKIHEETIADRATTDWKNRLEREEAYASSQFMTPEQRQEHFDKVFAELEADIPNKSKNQFTQTDLSAKLYALRQGSITKGQVDAADDTIDAAKMGMLETLDRQATDKDWGGARATIDKMVRLDLMDPGTGAAQKVSIDTAEQRDYWYQLDEPTRAKAAAAVVSGEESKDFKFLNEPGAAEKEYKFAREQRAIKDENWASEKFQQIWDGLNVTKGSGGVGVNQLTDAQIVTEGKLNGVSPDVIEQVRKANQANDKGLDLGKWATGRWMISNYNYRLDVDPKTGAPNPLYLNAYIGWAIDNLPHKEAQEMITALKSKFADGIQGKLEDAQSKHMDEAVKKLTMLKDSGNLLTPEGERIPSGVTKEDGDKEVDFAQMERANAAFNDAHDRMREWMKANPNANADEWNAAFKTFVKPYTEEAAKSGGLWHDTWHWWKATLSGGKLTPQEVEDIRKMSPGAGYPSTILEPTKPHPAPTPEVMTPEGWKGSYYPPGSLSNEGLATRRAPYVRQISGMMPLIAAVLAKEAGDPKEATAVLEALVNRTARETRNVQAQIFNGFYGPVNRGEVRQMLREGIPDWAWKNAKIAVANVAAGSNLARGATDQGMHGEIKGKKWKVGREWFGHFPKDPEFQT